MAGFVILNAALIIGGALVGAAGLILTILMGEAMNRSLANVLFSRSAPRAPARSLPATSREAGDADDVAIALAYADSVMVVPGYGLAVAQAQHAVRELATALEESGVEVAYAIHPWQAACPAT